MDKRILYDRILASVQIVLGFLLFLLLLVAAADRVRGQDHYALTNYVERSYHARYAWLGYWRETIEELDGKPGLNAEEERRLAWAKESYPRYKNPFEPFFAPLPNLAERSIGWFDLAPATVYKILSPSEVLLIVAYEKEVPKASLADGFALETNWEGETYTKGERALVLIKNYPTRTLDLSKDTVEIRGVFYAEASNGLIRVRGPGGEFRRLEHLAYETLNYVTTDKESVKDKFRALRDLREWKLKDGTTIKGIHREIIPNIDEPEATSGGYGGYAGFGEYKPDWDSMILRLQIDEKETVDIPVADLAYEQDLAIQIALFELGGREKPPYVPLGDYVASPPLLMMDYRFSAWNGTDEDLPIEFQRKPPKEDRLPDPPKRRSRR